MVHARRIWFCEGRYKSAWGQASAPQLILMDPRQALDIANAQVVKASKFIEEHSKRVWEYYNIEPKRKL